LTTLPETFIEGAGTTLKAAVDILRKYGAGYTADRRFIVRNSWGTSWGDHGFAYASEAYINAAFFNESYGVTV